MVRSPNGIRLEPGTPASPFLTIQYAIDVATTGDTLNVAAGAYNESLTIAKSLTLSCAQAGVPVGGRTAGSAAETVINASGLPVGVIVKASNVTLDGCDILGNTSTYAGVMLYASNAAGKH